MPACLEWGTTRHQECTATADQGYNECSASRDEGYRDCCDWWPCSWACDAWTWISNVVCVAWTWISNVVCVAWTWITTAICVLWDVVTTVVNAVLVVVESIVGWVLSAVAAIIELIEAIPILGTIVRWLLDGITNIINIIGSLPDALGGLIGIRPEKLLRVCPVILRDEKGQPVCSVPVAIALLQMACDVYKRDANVRIIPSRAFKFSTGFSGAETADESWLATDSGNSDGSTLDVPCDAGAEWWTGGSSFQLKMTANCFYGSWRRVLGYGAPITCFFIRSIPGAFGCDLWITDYATVVGSLTLPPPSARTLAHEVGHGCNLVHTCVDDDNANLMATGGACSPESLTEPDRANPHMSNLQAIAVRMSKHCTYF